MCPSPGWRGWPALPRPALLSRLAVVGVGMVLVIAPWTVRNVLALDTFIPIANNSGATLWAGHNPDAFGGAASVLVRPDGYVAWAGTDPAGLTGALHRWFGSPEAA